MFHDEEKSTDDKYLLRILPEGTLSIIAQGGVHI
jgi:hypothetical protein